MTVYRLLQSGLFLFLRTWKSVRIFPPKKRDNLRLSTHSSVWCMGVSFDIYGSLLMYMGLFWCIWVSFDHDWMDFKERHFILWAKNNKRKIMIKAWPKIGSPIFCRAFPENEVRVRTKSTINSGIFGKSSGRRHWFIYRQVQSVNSILIWMSTIWVIAFSYE